MIDQIKKELREHADAGKAELLQRFFKTGKGQYGDGDVFLGVMVPYSRAIAKKYFQMPLAKIKGLLDSEFHEERLVAGLILTYKYEKSSDQEKANIANFYLKNAKKFNNWDLVDLTSHKILGAFLVDKKRDVLYQLARSKNLWEKRISVIATFAFIRREDFKDSLALSELLLGDKHDLMHKAVGWMLREVGKKNQDVLRSFLGKHYKQMPRTMLRYSIEKFDEKERKKWLKK